LRFEIGPDGRRSDESVSGLYRQRGPAESELGGDAIKRLADWITMIDRWLSAKKSNKTTRLVHRKPVVAKGLDSRYADYTKYRTLVYKGSSRRSPGWTDRPTDRRDRGPACAQETGERPSTEATSRSRTQWSIPDEKILGGDQCLLGDSFTEVK